MPLLPLPKFVVVCWLSALLLGLLGSTRGVAGEVPRVRIAVVGDAESQDLSALVGTELSGCPEIALVEREDLSRLGDERKLELLADSDAVALGKLAGADSLLFVNKTAAGFKARFTAVGLGYALFDDGLGATQNPDQLARFIAHRVGDYASKLKLDPAKAVPLSILNLRCEIGGARAAKIERDVTLLLESRLSAVPEYIVLERRHAGTLGFERSLEPDPPPLPQGSCLVDGTLSLPAEGAGELKASLRLRAPSREAAVLEVRGRADDLPGLAERMTAAIRGAIGRSANPQPWQPEKEAREYLLEAIWGWQHNAHDAALEAVESAELLGEKAPDLTAVKINLLAGRAGQSLDLNPPTSDGPLPAGGRSLDDRTDDALQVIRETLRYADGQLEKKLQVLDSNGNMDVRAGEIERSAILLASALVAYLDRAGSVRAEELREALRPITRFDPLHGKAGTTMQDANRPLRDMFVDRWAASLEEELAYYHLRLTTLDQPFPPDVIRRGGAGFCPRFLKTPEAQLAAYERMVQGLWTDPIGRMAVLLIAACSTDPAAADAAYKGWLDELWSRRESLVGEKRSQFILVNSYAIPDAVRQRHAADLVPLLRYYLQNRNVFPDREWYLTAMWHPEGWSEAEAAAVLADYHGFRRRADEASKAKDIPLLSTGITTDWRRSLLKQFPGLAAPAPSNSPALTVTKYWYPSISPDKPFTWCELRSPVVTGDTLFMKGYPEGNLPGCAIYQIGLPGFATEAVALPEKMNPQQLTVTPEALYLDYYPIPGSRSGETAHRLGVFDRKTRAWATHEISIPFMHYHVVGGSFYLNLKHWSTNTSEEDGLVRYDLDTERSTVLASGRRNPPRNQLENRTGGVIGHVCAGPGGRLCAVTPLGVFYIQEQAGDWPEVFDAGSHVGTVACGEKTLVYDHFGEVVLLDPGRPAPEYLLAPDRPLYRKTPAGQPRPVMERTPWRDQALWQAPEGGGLNPFGDSLVGWHDERLFVLVPPAEEGKNYELLVYAKDTGRAPRRVALEFRLDEGTRARLAPVYQAGPAGQSRWTLDRIEHPGGQFFRMGLLAAESGLCLTPEGNGVWFVAYADIDKYLAGSTASPAGAGGTMVSLPHDPPDESKNH